MSQSKPNPPERRRRKPASSSPASPPVPPKTQVSGPLAALILIPVVGLFGWVLWAQIGQPGGATGESGEPAGKQPPTVVDTKPLSGVAAGAGAPDPVVWESSAARDRQWNRIDDASGDGWDTEQFTLQASGQLERLKKALQHPETLTDGTLAGLAIPGPLAGPLRPRQPQTVYEDGQLTVQRGTGETNLQPTATLVQAVQEIAGRYRDPEALRAKIKIFKVLPQQDGTMQTRQTVELFGPVADGLLEENMIWQAGWTTGPDGQPQLTRLQLESWEGVLRPGDTLFSDCTRSALEPVERFGTQLMTGYNYWLEEGQFREFFVTTGNPGISVGDVNQDGLEDLYVCQESGLANLLLLQQPDGTLRDASAESGADWLQNSRTALLVDFDNDGHRDLAVAMTGGVVLAAGDGTGRFAIRKVLDSSDDIVVLSAADYDLDGLLDLYAGAYYADKTGGEDQDLPVGSAGGSFVYVNSNDGGSNSLYRNLGQWEFADVTAGSGIDANNRRYSQGGAWADYDADGDPDLYIANDYGLNNLYRNDLQPDGTRRFVDIAAEADVEDGASGMSVAWGDYDRDGWLDLYISNMYSYAGNRITFQDRFKLGETEEMKQRFQRFARGNTFFRNPGLTGDESAAAFEDLSLQAGVNQGRWAWASRFVDLNNDSWEDLVVANGYITAEDTGDL